MTAISRALTVTAVAALFVIACVAPHAAHAAVGLVRQTSVLQGAGDGSPGAPASDGTHLYIPSSDSDALAKWHLPTMTRVGALPLGFSNLAGAAIDAGFAYVVQTVATTRVIKVNTAGAMTIASSLLLNGQALPEDQGKSIVSDGTHLYVANSGTTPSVISRVVIATFTRPGASAQLQLGVGEGPMHSMVIDPAKTHLFVCAYTTSSSPCVRILLSSFTRVDALALATDNVVSVAHDGTFLYAAADVSPAKVFKVNAAAMTLASTSALIAPNNNARAVLVVPADRDHIFVMLAASSPPTALKLKRSDLSLAAPAGTAGASDILPPPRGAVVVGHNVYSVGDVVGGRVIKWVAPTITRSRTIMPTTTTTTSTTTATTSTSTATATTTTTATPTTTSATTATTTTTSSPPSSGLRAGAEAKVSSGGVAGIAAGFGVFFVGIVAAVGYYAAYKAGAVAVTTAASKEPVATR